MSVITMARPDIEEVVVSPRLAEEYLTRNRSNRRLRAAVIARYAEDMRSGKWRLKGQAPILLDRDGALVNGQHRCLASVQSGVAFPVYVIRNVDPADVDTIDTGLTRSLGDVLGWRGEEQPHQLAAVVRIAWLYEKEKIRNSGFSLSPSRSEAVEWLQNHPGLQASLEAVTDLQKTLRVPVGAMATAHYFAKRRWPKETDAFFESLRSGAELPVGSPVLALRNRLTDRMFPAGSLRIFYVLAITIKAFNAFVEGRKVGLLRWSYRSKMAEDFPRIVG